MTDNTHTILLPDLEPSTFPDGDPRIDMGNSFRHGAAVMAAATPATLSNPTPCPDYDARAMAGHLVAVVRRFTAIAEGVAWEDTPMVIEGVADDAWTTEWQAAGEQLHRVFSADEPMEQVLRFPFGDMPGAIAMSIYAAEVLVHTWDLATGLGVEVDWDQDLAERMLPGLQMGLPNEGRELEEMPFAPVVATEPDASAIDRLVAWMGRQP